MVFLYIFWTFYFLIFFISQQFWISGQFILDFSVKGFVFSGDLFFVFLGGFFLDFSPSNALLFGSHSLSTRRAAN